MTIAQRIATCKKIPLREDEVIAANALAEKKRQARLMSDRVFTDRDGANKLS